MKITNRNLQEVFRLIREGSWKEVPVVRAQTRLAVNSLLAQDSDLFGKGVEEVLCTLRKDRNKGVAKIIKNTDLEAFAFAVYTATKGRSS